jgi:2'-5' RNA ligase
MMVTDPNKKPNGQRVFIVINPGNATRSRLTEIRNDLRACSKRGSFTSPQNMHLTLSFIGDCNDNQLKAIKRAMNSMTFNPFALTVERIGKFKRDGGDIWWAGVRTSPQLMEIQNMLTKRLRSEGITLPPEASYMPHITLGREIMTHEQQWHIEPFGEPVASIELMRSERVNGELVYTEMYKKSAR